MIEKRFTIYKEDKFKDEWYAYPFYIKDNGEKVTGTMPMGNAKEVANLLNSLQEEISYWKHRVSSLLWILSQFDNEKLKKLLEELDEREKI